MITAKREVVKRAASSNPIQVPHSSESCDPVTAPGDWKRAITSASSALTSLVIVGTPGGAPSSPRILISLANMSNGIQTSHASARRITWSTLMPAWTGVSTSSGPSPGPQRAAGEAWPCVGVRVQGRDHARLGLGVFGHAGHHGLKPIR
jgi:hypothetical protein